MRFPRLFRLKPAAGNSRIDYGLATAHCGTAPGLPPASVQGGCLWWRSDLRTAAVALTRLSMLTTSFRLGSSGGDPALAAR